MAGYRLTRAAEADFERLVEYGLDRFGLQQARDYRDSLKERFRAIAEHPNRYPAVDAIRSGYRRSVYGSHAIYYRIEDDAVTIVRILGRENPKTELPKVN
jgi:toxin ParE1/3/4